MGAVIDMSRRMHDCQQERPDPVKMAIAAYTNAADHLANIVLMSANRERMANKDDFRNLCHAATQGQFIATLVETRMIANGEIEVEDAP